MLIPIKLKFIFVFKNKYISGIASKLPLKERIVAGLIIKAERNPPITVLPKATITAEKNSLFANKIKMKMFANPSRIKGSGFGMKLSATYMVTAKAVKKPSRVKFALMGIF